MKDGLIVGNIGQKNLDTAAFDALILSVFCEPLNLIEVHEQMAEIPLNLMHV